MYGKRILIAVVAVVAAAALFFWLQSHQLKQQVVAAAAAVEEAAAPSKSERIGAIVRDYIMANPEIIEEAGNALNERREKLAAAERAKAIDSQAATIFNSEHQVVLGNPEGAITVVEFFDYNCGYCKRALSDMTALIAANPDLRMVLKEFPILSEGSLQAARVAVAVRKIAPEKYLEFHQELMGRPGEATTVKAMEIVRELGLDEQAVQTAADAPDVTESINEVHELAASLGISGTPSYVIGKELVPGAIGYDGLQEKVVAMRQCGSTIC